MLLHTRLSIYNNIYINHSHLTCLYYVYMYIIASCYINCLLFFIRLVNAATHLIKFKIYLRNMYKNIQHKFTLMLTKYITQTLQTKIIVTNKLLAVLHYCHVHVQNENTLIILILVCRNCVIIMVHMIIQKQCMNTIISFTLCSFLVYQFIFICTLISLSIHLLI